MMYVGKLKYLNAKFKIESAYLIATYVPMILESSFLSHSMTQNPLRWLGCVSGKGRLRITDLGKKLLLGMMIQIIICTLLCSSTQLHPNHRLNGSLSPLVNGNVTA